MAKYYLIHAVVNPSSKKVLKILADGYLYSSSYSKRHGMFCDKYLDYVYFSLLGDNPTYPTSLATFIIDSKILHRRSFRYSLTWSGDDFCKTKRVDYSHDDVNLILDKINHHVSISYRQNPAAIIGTHEILIKKKVSLKKYLIAICCGPYFSQKVVRYLNKFYPNVKIINLIPKTANDLTTMLC